MDLIWNFVQMLVAVSPPGPLEWSNLTTTPLPCPSGLDLSGMAVAEQPLVQNETEGSWESSKCLGAKDLGVGVVLILLILVTVGGNTLVILSVCIYRRMRTFTNLLLVALAATDLLVGVLVMPSAMLDLLYGSWPFGVLLCKLWATADVLLCTASILNLVVISLDRYCAITWPLKYMRRRSRALATSLAFAVYLVSLIICSPPWFIPDWGWSTSKTPTGDNQCRYVNKLSYRIYSAFGSFFLPLFVMLFVYYRILRVANTREETLNVNRTGSRKVKMFRGGATSSDALSRPSNLRRNMAKTTAAPLIAARFFVDSDAEGQLEPLEDHLRPNGQSGRRRTLKRADTDPTLPIGRVKLQVKFATQPERRDDLESSANLELTATGNISPEDSTAATTLEHPARHGRQVRNSIAAGNHYGLSGRREKLTYLKERKALRTIGVVVCGFIVCWLPFFTLYLLQACLDSSTLRVPEELELFFLWAGYGNSVLNPLIYTCYSADFRRCFKDLLSCGCLRRGVDRRMSVRRLYQTRV